MMEIPPPLIVAFPPSKELLLDRARQDVDDAMLMVIARADYGMGAEEIMAELLPIRDNGILPNRISGDLREVLELTRWSNPEEPNAPPFEPGPSGIQGHQAVVFACGVLMASQFKKGPDDSTLARILVSGKLFGEEINEAIGCFLTAQSVHLDRGFFTVLFALALLIVAIRGCSQGLTESELGTIAEWVLDEEAFIREEFASHFKCQEPPPAAFSLSQGFWQPLAKELLDAATESREEELRTNLQLCALLLGAD